MSWFTVGAMAVSAVMSSEQAKNKSAQQKKFNQAQAETTRYSPWTGMKGQLDSSYTPSSTEAGFGGAIQGLGMAQSMKGAGFGQSQPNYTQGMNQDQMNVFNGINQQQGSNQAADAWSMFGNNRRT